MPDESPPSAVNLAEIRSRVHLLDEGDVDGWACLRLVVPGDRLDWFLFRGEIVEFVERTGTPHRLGNVVPGVKLPKNPGKRDWFLLVARAHVARLQRAFVVTGPTADRSMPRPVLRLVSFNKATTDPSVSDIARARPTTLRFTKK